MSPRLLCAKACSALPCATEALPLQELLSPYPTCKWQVHGGEGPHDTRPGHSAFALRSRESPVTSSPMTTHPIAQLCPGLQMRREEGLGGWLPGDRMSSQSDRGC